MDDHDSFKPSKSQRKRDMIALQALGETLVALPDAQLNQLPLPSDLKEAILHARKLSSHEAKRRQLQYIGRLMRSVDPAPITEALAAFQLKNQQSKAAFHQVERWRDRLIAEGDVQLQLFIKTYPDTDAQQLRQLIRQAQHDAQEGKNQGYAKALFQYLKKIVTAYPS